MVKKTKGKHRLDKFYHLAKEQGYRSRAAFKLIQLNRKYDFLSSARTVLDLCAAPGGWCQVAVKTMPVGSLIIGVDLIPIKPIRGVKTLIGDITTQQCRQAILKETGGSLMDVVLHDGAPNVGGAWSSEAYAQSWLVLESLKMATDVLAPQGTFVTKIFRSKDYTALLYAFNQLFTKVEATKPAASRNASAEIFVVCRGYKAPSRIDPRLLDAKYLFKEVADAPKVGGPDALLKAKVKQKRFREGYEDGMTIARKVIGALAFVMAPNPIELLGQVTSIAIDGPESNDLPEESETIPDPSSAAEFLRSHPATSEEIRILLQDLQVIGRSEFKALLKWRLSVRKDLIKYLESQREDEKQSLRETSEDEGNEASDVIEVKTIEDRLLEEMEAVKSRLQRREKRDRKRRRELKLKSRLRAIQLAQLEGIADGEADPNGPDGLFSLTQIRSKTQASNVADADVPTESESEQEGSDLSSNNSIDSDEERNEEDAKLDQYLEESYKAWKIRQRMRESGGGVVKKRRKRLGADGELEDDFDDVDTFAFENDKGMSEEEEEEEDSDNGLLVSLDNRKKNKLNPDAATEQWFAQDLFNDEDLEEDEENFKRKENQRLPETVVKSNNNNSPDGVPEVEDDDNEKIEAKQEDEKEALRRAFAGNEKSSANGFEVVPLSESDGGDSDEEEFEALNDDAKAEILALAKRFIRRKDKENLMEAAYNRYAFHDTNLPKWFMEDESKFMRPAPQLSAAEIAEAKERLRAIDARPIKKVVEAKARKRKRLAAKLSQARQKAESIAGQEDMPMAAKMREIEKLYAKARAGGGSKKGKNGKKSSSRRDGKKRKGPPLDPRLRSDKRGMDAAAKRMKNKVGKKGRR